MNSRTDVAQLIRLDPPPVEADPVFLARLAGLATASRPSPTPAGRVGGLRIAAAAAGVLAVTAGAAVAAQHVATRDDGPQPVRPVPVSPDVTRPPDRPADTEARHDGVRPGEDTSGPGDRATDDHAGAGSQPSRAPDPAAAPTSGVEPGDNGHESDGVSTSPTESGSPGDDQGDQGDDHQGSDQGDQGDQGGSDTGSSGSGDGDSGDGGNDGSDDPTAGSSAGDGSGDGDLGVVLPDTGDGDGGQTDH